MPEPLRSLLRSSPRRWRIGIVNGPNISNLERFAERRFGKRSGLTNVKDLRESVELLADALGLDCTWMASNFEGEILEWVHAAPELVDAIIINPGGLTQFGGATRHALGDTGLPVIECHFGNLAQRGVSSIFAPTVEGSVTGLLHHSYSAALVAMAGLLDARAPAVGGSPEPTA